MTEIIGISYTTPVILKLGATDSALGCHKIVNKFCLSWIISIHAYIHHQHPFPFFKGIKNKDKSEIQWYIKKGIG